MVSREYIHLLQTMTPMESPDIAQRWEEFRVAYLEFGSDRRSEVSYLVLQVKLLALSRAALSMVATTRGILFDVLIVEAIDLHERKNNGYSGANPDPWSNFRTCLTFDIHPIDGIVTRMCDKISRYTHVTANGTLDRVNESAIDTLLDLAAYALILYCMLVELLE